MSVLGATAPDPFGQILGTGYDRFKSPTGMNGLAKVSANRIDILALDATIPGTGQLRNFIDQCKREYETVCIWEVWNPWLHEVLRRYGFRALREADPDTGEELDGYRYDAGGVTEDG